MHYFVSNSSTISDKIVSSSVADLSLAHKRVMSIRAIYTRKNKPKTRPIEVTNMLVINGQYVHCRTLSPFSTRRICSRDA